MQHPRQHDVVGKACLPGDLGAAVDAPARVADDFELALRAHLRSSRRSLAARSIESTICWYPVQRQSTPAIASLIRSRLGAASASSSAFAVISRPGVQ